MLQSTANLNNTVHTRKKVLCHMTFFCTADWNPASSFYATVLRHHHCSIHRGRDPVQLGWTLIKTCIVIPLDQEDIWNKWFPGWPFRQLAFTKQTVRLWNMFALGLCKSLSLLWDRNLTKTEGLRDTGKRIMQGQCGRGRSVVGSRG